MSNPTPTPQSSTSDLKPLIPSPKSPPKKQSLGEKVLSAMFDGPPGTKSSKLAHELKDKWDEDKLDISRTEKEEKERQARIAKRNEMVRGGDGARTNDLQKGGWGGAMLADGNI
ncbi:hypothetical protein GLAREA_05859 [Glarea lozoyensis ATCC 20868]|uniref:Uncharacterized protein n=1 Tax=Glarea lozoyensis (strain ATCC 20868 / MF5171) TaxID=1116229 RepID=S3D2Y7_GLAL2|nr:uncharacterized protein GLAREA_05859 [Glarea lozoyensis ATCC 20868]EPE32847.1 hypothetical protein GLAREA_05859 [Glarea lozoyensis ATCC 20868]